MFDFDYKNSLTDWVLNTKKVVILKVNQTWILFLDHKLELKLKNLTFM